MWTEVDHTDSITLGLFVLAQPSLNRAIIIGNNPGSRQDMQKWLVGKGIEVIRSAGSFDAIAEELDGSAFPVDLAVVDLPFNSGKPKETLIAMHKHSKTTGARILLAGLVDESEQIEALLEQNVSGLLTKPLSKANFLSSLEEFMGILQQIGGAREALLDLNKAHLMANLKEFDGALTVLNKMKATYDCAMLNFRLGKVYAAKGIIREAVDNYKKAIEREPKMKLLVKNYIQNNPIKPKKPVNSAPRQIKPDPQPTSPYPKRRAIIINDNPGLRNDIKASLAIVNIEVVKTCGKYETAEEFVKVEQSKLDLIVLDTKMAGEPATSVIEKMDKNVSLMGVDRILMIDKDKCGDVSDLFDRGVIAYALKPFQAGVFGEYLKSLEQLKASCKSDTKYLSTIAAADFFEKTNDFVKAIKYLQQQIAKRETPKSYFDLGRMLVKTGEHEKGVKCFEKASALEPRYKQAIANFLAENPIKIATSPAAKESETAPTLAAEICLGFEADMEVVLKNPMKIDRECHVLVISRAMGEIRDITEILKSIGVTNVSKGLSARDAKRTLEKSEVNYFFISCRNEKDTVELIELSQIHENFNGHVILNFESPQAAVSMFETYSKMGADWFLINPLTTKKTVFSLHNMQVWDALAESAGEGRKLSRIAYALYRMKRYKKVVEMAGLAWSKQPFDGAALLLRGLAYQKLGQIEEASADFATAKRNAPNLESLIDRLMEAPVTSAPKISQAV